MFGYKGKYFGKGNLENQKYTAVDKFISSDTETNKVL